MTNLKTWVLFIVVMISATFISKCRTAKPAIPSLPTIAKVIKDTVVLKPIVVTAPIETIQVPIEKVDTVLVQHEVTNVRTGTMDTAKLYAFLENYHGEKSQEMVELKGTIISLQTTINGLQSKLFIKSRGEDSFRNKLDTSRQIVAAAKNVIAVNNNLLYNIPTISYLIIAIIAISIAGSYKYTQYRLKQKGIDVSRRGTHVLKSS